MPFVAIAALSLSPAFVLWAGGVATLTLWVVFGTIVTAMDRRVSWTDMPIGAGTETYLAVLLDPAFIGTGNRIEESLIILSSAGVIALAVARARALVRARAQAQIQRRRAERVFGQYVPIEVAQTLLTDEGALRPQTLPASILFVDLAGFTSLAERLPPVQVLELLSGFFGAAGEVVTRERGVVLSFAGDALLAAFNAPLPEPAHAERAVAAALGLAELARRQSFGGVWLSLRVGIATGPVAAGVVGSSARQSFTVYGDTVNLAQRLEALNKATGTTILVCETTVQAAGERRDFVLVERALLPGRTSAVAAYAPRAGR